MSVLEFISSLKWPVVVLVALAVVSRGFKRNPDMGAWFRQWLDSRDVRGKIGPTEFEATASQAASALQAAAASDGDLERAAAAELGDSPSAPEAVGQTVAEMRREAVEDVMRSSARWGFDLAGSGLPRLPRLDVTWSQDGLPAISLASPQGPSSVSFSERRILEAIEQTPAASFGELARVTGLSIERVRQIVRSLENRGVLASGRGSERPVLRAPRGASETQEG